MSTASKIIKNTGFLYVRIGITMFVALWTTRIVLNILGEDNYGIYSLVAGVVSMLGFLNASLSSATQRFINIAEGKNDLEEKRKVFNNSLTLHSLLALLLIVLLILIGIFSFKYLLEIPSNSLYAAKCVYACMICTTAFSVMNVPYESVINAHENMGFYALVGIFEAIMKVAIAFIIMYANTDKLILYGLLMTFTPLITLFILRIYCHRHYDECAIHPLHYYNKNTIRSLSGFAGWNFLNTASGVLTQSGFNITINHFFGVALNAAQGITHQVGSALMSLSSNAEKALNPVLVKSEGSNQRARMIYLSLMGCKMSFFIFSTFSIFFIAEMPQILNLWLKNVPEWTALFCQLQLFRVILELLTRGVHMSIMAQGNIKCYCIWRSIVNIIPIGATMIAFNYGFAPYWMYIFWTLFWSIIGGTLSIKYAKSNVGLQYSTYIETVLVPSMKAIIPPTIIIVVCKILVSSQFVDIITVACADILFIVLSWRLLLTDYERKELCRIFRSHFMKKN